MKPLGLLVAASLATAACSAGSPTQSQLTASSAAQATVAAPTCATADAMLGSLMTLVRNSTHLQAPAAERPLLDPLDRARAALRARPCDKDAAIAALNDFKYAVDANRALISSTQVIAFKTLADRIIAVIRQVP